MSEEEYVCKRCGEPWEEEQTVFYINGKCANCGAPTAPNRVKADKENPLLRDEDE